MLYVNGMPLVIVELKRAGAASTGAASVGGADALGAGAASPRSAPSAGARSTSQGVHLRKAIRLSLPRCIATIVTEARGAVTGHVDGAPAAQVAGE